MADRSEEQGAQMPFFFLWSNPIIRRYVRSRLRTGPLVGWSVLTVVMTSFLFLSIFLTQRQFGNASLAESAKATFFPLLVLQVIILMLKGSFATGAGITREANDGIIDYQRLTPMSPMAKIMGYLFGLPILEYVMFAITVPFTIFAVVAGEIPIPEVLKLYLVFFTSTVMYHSTSLVAGTVVKQKVIAGIASQFVMLVLYLGLPLLMSRIGFVFFQYFGIYPVAIEFGISQFELPNGQPIDTGVAFFDIHFTELQFSLLVQLSMIATLLTIIYRKWRRPNCHLLGKNFAVALFLLIQILLLGNALPLIEKGQMFQWIGDQFGPQGRAVAAMRTPATDAAVFTGFFALVSLIIMWMLVSVITPSRDSMLRGLRRANKMGLKRVPEGSDDATSLWHTIALAVIASLTWILFARGLFNSLAYSGIEVSSLIWLVLPAIGILPAVCFQAIYELKGKRVLVMFCLFGWIVPIMAALIIGIIEKGVDRVAVYCLYLSPLTTPIGSMTALIDGALDPGDENVKGAITLFIVVYALLSGFLVHKLFRYHRSLKSLIE